MSTDDDTTGFDVSDFFELNEWIGNYFSTPPSYDNMNEVDGMSVDPYPMGGANNVVSSIDMMMKLEKKERVAFKTKSEVEILDDGFKWRKYGKKMVKNSPNPRNYYKCSFDGCSVKKRVERDNDDPRYVVTTYEGIHNHVTK